MSNTITWRNVNAPSQSNAEANIVSGAQGFGNALRSLGTAATSFGDPNAINEGIAYTNQLKGIANNFRLNDVERQNQSAQLARDSGRDGSQIQGLLQPADALANTVRARRSSGQDTQLTNADTLITAANAEAVAATDKTYRDLISKKGKERGFENITTDLLSRTVRTDEDENLNLETVKEFAKDFNTDQASSIYQKIKKAYGGPVPAAAFREYISGNLKDNNGLYSALGGDDYSIGSDTSATAFGKRLKELDNFRRDVADPERKRLDTIVSAAATNYQNQRDTFKGKQGKNNLLRYMNDQVDEIAFELNRLEFGDNTDKTPTAKTRAEAAKLVKEATGIDPATTIPDKDNRANSVPFTTGTADPATAANTDNADSTIEFTAEERESLINGTFNPDLQGETPQALGTNRPANVTQTRTTENPANIVDPDYRDTGIFPSIGERRDTIDAINEKARQDFLNELNPTSEPNTPVTGDNPLNPLVQAPTPAQGGASGIPDSTATRQFIERLQQGTPARIPSFDGSLAGAPIGPNRGRFNRGDANVPFDPRSPQIDASTPPVVGNQGQSRANQAISDLDTVLNNPNGLDSSVGNRAPLEVANSRKPINPSPRIFKGAKAVKEVVAREGELTNLQKRLIDDEGYSPDVYADTGGIATTGVGQTGDFMDGTFKEAFDVKLDVANSLVPNFDSFSEDVQYSILQAVYRGDARKGDKWIKELNDGNYAAAGEEILNHEEYEDLKARGIDNGVTRRLEAASEALIAYEANT